MTEEQRQELLEALRHGHTEPELEEVLIDDLIVIEPLVDKWIREAIQKDREETT